MSKKTRWYSGFSYKGKPQKLVEVIARKVSEHELSSYVPLIRIEKKAKKGQFYFFLAIESEQPGEYPEQVKNNLITPLPCFKYPISGTIGFDYEQIKPMVGTAHEVHDYVNLIPYKVNTTYEEEDPFATFWLDSPPQEYQREAPEKYQDLLYWLSGTGQGSWRLFQQACQTLNINHPTRIMRRLKLLGHLETSNNGKNWSITPTCLVYTNSKQGYHNYFLCGQQSPILLKELEKFSNKKIIKQPLNYAPPCQIFSFSDSINLGEVIDSIKHQLGLTIYQTGNVAEKLANLLPLLSEWSLKLNTLGGIVKSNYSWKYYHNGEFINYLLPKPTGMYQMCSSQRGDKPILTLFYEAETDTWRQGDWYGLRFLALQKQGEKCLVRYEQENLRLAIPYAQRWPELYERALVLASGRLPKYQQSEAKNLWLIYENISWDLVQILTQKLGVIGDEVISNV